jgi:hypothetical protein
MNKHNQFLRLQAASLIKRLAKSQQNSPTEAEDIRIGIWGTSGSGKTTYLAMLYYALLLSKDWQVTADSKARQFVTESIKVIKEGKFPATTEITPNIEIFTYTLARQKSSTEIGPKVVLNFIDAPGEFYEEIHSANASVTRPSIRGANSETQVGPNQGNKTGIIDYLISCDGIIFLLDPLRSNEEGDLYWRLLFDLFMEFQERSQQESMSNARLQQYMAFCVTKVDKEEIWSQGKRSADLAKDVMGHSLFTSLETAFCLENRYEFYSVASIGRYFDKDDELWKEAVNYPSIPDNSKTSETQKDLSSPTSPRRRYAHQKSKDLQDPVASPGQPNTNLNSSPSSEDSWDSLSSPSNTPEPPLIPLPTINTKVEYAPFNVITPIEWLINSIQNQPPSRPQPKQE